MLLAVEIVVVSVWAQVSIGFHSKMKADYEGGFKRSVERIGSLRSTRESVVTILCHVS